MSMIPFFPSLRPSIANRIWFGSTPLSEEAGLLRHEREFHQLLDGIKNAASDLPPLGKVLTIPGPETDDEDANDDDTDDSEEDEDTNDRPIPGQPEHLGLYSPPEESPNDNPLAETL